MTGLLERVVLLITERGLDGLPLLVSGSKLTAGYYLLVLVARQLFFATSSFPFSVLDPECS